MMMMDMNDDRVEMLVDESITTLLQADINFVAIDFDNTLINIHTWGKYKKSPVELAQYIRPIFKDFIPALVEKGIYVAIVTFSSQVALIRETLGITFPMYYTSIPVVGKQGNRKEGKMQHMADAVADIQGIIRNSNRDELITRASTLLVDDEVRNVRHALDNDVRALQFHIHQSHNFDDEYRLLKDIIEYVT